MPQGYYFTISYDSDGWRGRFYYNNELIWWTEGYARYAGAKNALDAIKQHGGTAPLI
jgi:uncharacterized protein YegP (UPF0339 family)